MSNPDPNIFRLSNVRLSFPEIWAMKPGKDGGTPCFSASFIFDNADPQHQALLDRMEQQAERIALDKFQRKIRLSGPLVRDGNDYADTDGYGDGTSFISARQYNQRPWIVDLDPSIPLVKEDNRPEAGDYVNAAVKLWVQDSHGQKRVNAELLGIQFLKKGARFAGGPMLEATQLFENLGGSAGGQDNPPTSTRSTRSAAPQRQSNKPADNFF